MHMKMTSVEEVKGLAIEGAVDVDHAHQSIRTGQRLRSYERMSISILFFLDIE